MSTEQYKQRKRKNAQDLRNRREAAGLKELRGIYVKESDLKRLKLKVLKLIDEDSKILSGKT